MERIIQLSGKVSSNGKPLIIGAELFFKFFEYWKNKDFIMELHALDKGSTDRHIWYIVKMVVPAFIKGYRDKGELIDHKRALEIIIESCPLFYKTPNKTYSVFDWSTFKPNCEMSREELEIAIDWLILFCMENFNIVIR